MRKRTTAVLAVALCVLAVSAWALGPQSYPVGTVSFDTHEHQTNVVRPGESIHYEFSWNGIRAAEVRSTVEADPNRDGWICVEAEGEIVGAAALVYRGKDSVKSCMNAAAMKPDKYFIRIRESLDYYDSTTDFNHAEGTAFRVKKYRTRTSEKTFHFENVYGPVSLVGKVRSLPWPVGTKRAFEAIDGNNRWLVVIESVKEEKVETPAGTFDAVQLVPSLFELPSDGGNTGPGYWRRQRRKDAEKVSLIKSFTLWMAKDPPRHVLKVRTDVFFGHVDMVLTDFVEPPGKPGPLPGADADKTPRGAIAPPDKAKAKPPECVCIESECPAGCEKREE